jgi:hypothetical protein
MMLHFAYGANMSRTVMRKYAPQARALARAELPGFRFVITADGYASVVPAPGPSVHGVLWRITPRDRALLDAWENVAAGLYGARMLTVRSERGPVPALVYVARPAGEGRPRPGYMELVIAAARDWNLPASYIRELERLRPAAALGVGARKLGESD